MKTKFLITLALMSLTTLASCSNNGGGSTSTSSSTPTYYKVDFMNEDELFSSQTVEKGKTATKPATDPTKPSSRTTIYTFDAWYNGTTKFDFSTPIVNNLQLTAKYSEATKKVTITYDFNDGVTTTETKQIDIDSAIPAPTGTPTGYIEEGYQYNFDNWKCGQTVLEPDVTIASEDMTFVAQYKKGDAITYTATVKYLYDKSITDKTFDYTIETRDDVLADIEKELPATPANEYYWKGGLPETLPLEDGTYSIQSKHFFTNDFTKGEELDTDHLQFSETSKWSIKDNLLHYQVVNKNDSLLRTVAEDYDSFVLEYVCKSESDGTSLADRTGVNLGNSDFDSSATWLRMSKNYQGGTGEIISYYSTGGATFNAGDFNSYKFEVYKNGNGAGRVRFYLNGVNILGGTSAYTLIEPCFGFIGFTVCPKSGVTPVYSFKSISIKPYVA